MRYFFIIFLFTLKLNACDCDVPIPILEFYNSEYVFEGVVASKVYNEDYETYSIAFKVDKHYKEEHSPKVLRFTLKSEELYTDTLNSCDWSVNIGEKWLVYAYRDINKHLKFTYYCSNSKKLDQSIIDVNERKVLENGNDFIIGDYIYESQHGFTNPKPVTNIDSIIKTAIVKDYKKSFTIVKLHINTNGVLQSVIGHQNYSAIKIDEVFNLPYAFKVIEEIPLSDFEKEAIKVAKEIKKWEIKYYKKTKTPVAYIKSIIFKYDATNKKWSYEL